MSGAHDDVADTRAAQAGRPASGVLEGRLRRVVLLAESGAAMIRELHGVELDESMLVDLLEMIVDQAKGRAPDPADLVKGGDARQEAAQ